MDLQKQTLISGPSQMDLQKRTLISGPLQVDLYKWSRDAGTSRTPLIEHKFGSPCSTPGMQHVPPYYSPFLGVFSRK